MVSAEHLYQMVILEHAKDTLYTGLLQGDTVHSIHERNNSCGDDLTLYVDIVDNVVKDIKYEITGCILSKAACSMLCGQVIGKDIAEVRDIINNFSLMITGDTEYTMHAQELEILYNVVKFPVRIKCVMMPFKALESVLDILS